MFYLDISGDYSHLAVVKMYSERLSNLVRLTAPSVFRQRFSELFRIWSFCWTNSSSSTLPFTKPYFVYCATV